MFNLKIGSTLQSGKYIIEKILGQGGFGITYLASQPMLNRKVAIKEFFYKEFCNRDASNNTISVISKGGEDTVRKFLAKFLKEARTIASLKHPNIIEVYDVFEENGTAYYVMEYVEGETLTDYVKREGKLSESLALEYIQKVASALSFIHGKHINHLDIKPSNIMLRKRDNEIIVIDFGMAKHYDVTTGDGTTTTPIGISPGYAPLEQYRQGGVSSFTPESDIYSLGATLYKLVTGETPKEASALLEEGGIENIHSVSFETNQAISKAMQTSKSRRQHSVDEFLSMLPISKVASQVRTLETTNNTEKSSPIITQNEEEYIAPSQRIHWNSEDESKLDLGWHDKIGMIYKGVLWGSGLTLLFGVGGGLVQYSSYGLVTSLIVIVPSIILGILGIIGALGIEKRKPNSVFLCLVYSWICTVSNVINIITSIAQGEFPGILALVWLVYGIAIICALYSSDDVKLIFPKEYRKISNTDKVLATVCILVELFIILLIFIGLMS